MMTTTTTTATKTSQKLRLTSPLIDGVEGAYGAGVVKKAADKLSSVANQPLLGRVTTRESKGPFVNSAQSEHGQYTCAASSIRKTQPVAASNSDAARMKLHSQVRDSLCSTSKKRDALQYDTT